MTDPALLSRLEEMARSQERRHDEARELAQTRHDDTMRAIRTLDDRFDTLSRDVAKVRESTAANTAHREAVSDTQPLAVKPSPWDTLAVRIAVPVLIAAAIGVYWTGARSSEADQARMQQAAHDAAVAAVAAFTTAPAKPEPIESVEARVEAVEPAAEAVEETVDRVRRVIDAGRPATPSP